MLAALPFKTLILLILFWAENWAKSKSLPQNCDAAPYALIRIRGHHCQGLVGAPQPPLPNSRSRLVLEAGPPGFLKVRADNAVVGTVSASLESGPLTYAATYSLQENLITDAPDTLEHLIDLSLEYTLGEDASFAGETWSLGAGCAYAVDAEGQDSHAIGARLTIELDGTYRWGRSQDEAAEPPGQTSTADEASAAGEPSGNVEDE